MKKRIYRSTPIRKFDVSQLDVTDDTVRVVVGLDVAKHSQVMALSVSREEEAPRLVSWRHPDDTSRFFGVLGELAGMGLEVEVVLEPSGTYGDPFVEGLQARKIGVYRVSGKVVHDAREVFDGVPSSHDPKAARVIAWLHWMGRSEVWRVATKEERVLRAGRDEVNLHAERRRQVLNMIEAQLARHWPELTAHLALTRVGLLHLLTTFGAPADVARDPDGARQLLRKVGHAYSDATVEAVVASAQTTCGVPMIDAERFYLMQLAEEALGARERGKKAERRLVEAGRQSVPETMSKMLGMVTACVLIASNLDPRRYDSPQAYRKALGLNLRESSSGTKKGRLHLTKRGNSVGRRWLYFAALRAVRLEPIARAWYRKKCARDGNTAKMRGVIAVQRKLAVALWHVARGAEFDASKLYDTRKLTDWLEPPTTEDC